MSALAWVAVVAFLATVGLTAVSVWLELRSGPGPETRRYFRR